MGYTYLDHDADIGIRCTGANLQEAFEEGGRALLALTVDPATVRPLRRYPMTCHAEAVDSLFVAYLNEILSQMGRYDAVFTGVAIDEIVEQGDGHVLHATLFGEETDLGRHILRTEVKAATYGGLKCTAAEGQFILQCVLDV